MLKLGAKKQHFSYTIEPFTEDAALVEGLKGMDVSSRDDLDKALSQIVSNWLRSLRREGKIAAVAAEREALMADIDAHQQEIREAQARLEVLAVGKEGS